MNRIVALVLCIGVSATLVAAGDSDGKRWWSHVAALAGDSLEGRNTGSVGHRKAAEYAIEQFERVGLEPSGVQGFVQPVPFDGRTIVEATADAPLNRDLRPNSEYYLTYPYRSWLRTRGSSLARASGLQRRRDSSIS